MQRSHAFGLVENGASDAEIARAIRDADRSDLVAALEGVLTEMAPACDIEISAAIGQVVRLIGADWSKLTREDFVTGAVDELLDYPGGMVLDALKRARRRVTAGRMLIVWVCEDIEPKVAKLKLESERLTRLVELSVPAA